MKKIKASFGLMIAAAAGISAFLTEIDNQKKEKKINEMEKRLTNLENKEA